MVEGNAIELSQNLTNAFGGRVTSHRQFGTANGLLMKKKLNTALGISTKGDLPNQLTDQRPH